MLEYNVINMQLPKYTYLDYLLKWLPFAEVDLPKVWITVCRMGGYTTIWRTIAYNTKVSDIYLNCERELYDLEFFLPGMHSYIYKNTSTEIIWINFIYDIHYHYTKTNSAHKLWMVKLRVQYLTVHRRRVVEQINTPGPLLERKLSQSWQQATPSPGYVIKLQ